MFLRYLGFFTNIITVIAVQSHFILPKNGQSRANNGSFNKGQWIQGTNSIGTAVQQNGILALTQNTGTHGEIRLIARQYNQKKLSDPTFFEAKMMLDPERHDGEAKIVFGITSAKDFSATQYLETQCEMDDDAEAKCRYLNSSWEELFVEPEWYPTEYGTWHTFRIEVDPNSMEFRYFIDGQLQGLFVPPDAETLKQDALFDFSIVVSDWDLSGNVTGYFDDVRIGQIGQ